MTAAAPGLASSPSSPGLALREPRTGPARRKALGECSFLGQPLRSVSWRRRSAAHRLPRMSMSSSRGAGASRDRTAPLARAGLGVVGEEASPLRRSPASSASDRDPGLEADLALEVPQWVDFLNSCSKWIAVVGCTVALAALHNRESLWFSIGMIGNAFLAKLLKRLFRQQRPESARGKDDYGMPSSHAQSLTFLGTYAALSILSSLHIQPVSVGLTAATAGSCMFLTWLRVLGGLHSPAQVVVGALIGLVDAYTWKASFEMFRRAIAQGNISADMFNSLLLALFIATLCFAVWREVDSKKVKADT